MLTRDERVALLDWGRQDLPLKTQAELLGLNRSGLYYVPKPPSAKELMLKRAIDEIYTQYPFFGSRRITAMLHRQGHQVNRKAVQRHMREMGLEAVYPGPNLSQRNQQHKVFPYLLRNATIQSPNAVWGTDITYIRLCRGWMYLVVVMDWYSRYIVSWELSDNLESAFVISAVRRALQRAKPEIINSDQGSQYTSPTYTKLVQSAGVRISMDGKGRALDNVFTERFWRSLKYEEVYIKEYRSPREARKGISEYIELYNYDRPHQSLNNRTPAEVYLSTTAGPAPRAVTQIPSLREGESSLNYPKIVS